MKLLQRIVLGYYRNKFNTLALIAPQKAAAMAFELFCTPYTRKRNFVAPQLFSTAQPLSLNIDKVTTKGFYWKPQHLENCKTILICHGFDSYSYRFEKYVEGLLAKGFDVIAFDAPAHGISEGKTITVLQYRNMILQINERLGPIDGIVAHSFGGLAVALAVEEAKQLNCKRLVLLAPATETTHAIESFFKFVQASKRVRIAFNELVERLAGNPASWFSVARILQHIHVPTLWIHDRLDTITPYADMHYLTEKDLPHIEFEITEGMGHSLYTEESVIKRVVDYFAELNHA